MSAAGPPGGEPVHTGRADDLGADDHVVRSRQRRRTARAAAYAASLALLLWAVSVVPLPYTEYVPGTPTPIPPLLEVEGTQTDDLSGDTALLTVLLRSSTPRTAVGALLDPDRRLRPTAEVIPSDVERDEFLAQERQRFQRQFEVSAAVGAEAAGVSVELTTAPLVVDVVEGGPSVGRLQAGDLVRSVEGEPVDGAEQLQEAVRSHEVGDRVTVTVDRQGQPTEVEVALEPLQASPGPGSGDGSDAGEGEGEDGQGSDTGGGADGGGADGGGAEPGGDRGAEDADGDGGPSGPPGLGILIETVADELDLPFDLALADTRIGGPSAGLMIALTVYDLLDEEDLLDDRTVYGTGSLDAEGRVGPVGGVPEKMRSAAEADLVLVPAMLVDDARAAAPEGLEIVGVATFEEALEALRR